MLLLSWLYLIALQITAMGPYLKKGWVLVNTSAHPDTESHKIWFGHNIKPDMALYDSQRPEGARLCDASKAVMFGEFKIKDEDEPFQTEQLEPFERDTNLAADTRGQLTVYMNAIQATQHRTRVFLFYIRKNLCRLLCHSRSGTLVTPLIDYTTTNTMQTFFWRLTHAKKAYWGIDTTFKRVAAGDLDPVVLAAREALGIERDNNLFKVFVPVVPPPSVPAVPSPSVPAVPPPSDQCYYVSEPFTTNHVFPVSRGTRCFAAYDPTSKRLVLFKDTWRIQGYNREDDIYAQLHAGQVPNIPTVLAAGDVIGHFHECGSDMRRKTIRQHIHYRIVLREYGEPLHKFRSSHQLITVILDAFIGA